jgi:hypothetical protein
MFFLSLIQIKIYLMYTIVRNLVKIPLTETRFLQKIPFSISS